MKWFLWVPITVWHLLTVIKKLDGTMIVLNEKAMGAIDCFNATYCPNYENLENVQALVILSGVLLIRRSLSSHLLSKLLLPSINYARRRHISKWDMTSYHLVSGLSESGITTPEGIFFQRLQRLNGKDMMINHLFVTPINEDGTMLANLNQ